MAGGVFRPAVEASCSVFKESVKMRRRAGASVGRASRSVRGGEVDVRVAAGESGFERSVSWV